MNVQTGTTAADPFVAAVDTLKAAVAAVDDTTATDAEGSTDLYNRTVIPAEEALRRTPITTTEAAVRAAELLASRNALLSDAGRDEVQRSVQSYLRTLGGGNAAAASARAKKKPRRARGKARAVEPSRPVTSPPPTAPCGDDGAWNYIRLEGCYIDIQSSIAAIRALLAVGHDDEVRGPAREAFEEVLDNLASRINQLCDDGKAHFVYWVDAGAFK